MADNFLSAAARHYVDSGLLLASRRIDNAGYLAGYTVECSLKAIILHGSGRNPKTYGHELSTLGGLALDLALLLSPSWRRYRPKSITEILAVFGDWNPEWRYSTTGELLEEKANDLVMTAEKAFKEILIPLVLDGWEEIPQ
ncbi:MAG: hypothetical protein AAB354_06555 [candidate division KSB1 bacterium]